MKHNKEEVQLNQHSPQFVFAKNFKGSRKNKNLIRLIPYGVSIAGDGTQPVLLLKDETSEHTLPVNLNPVEAGMTLMQFNQSMNLTTPHRLFLEMLTHLKLQVESCVFTEIRGPHQIVTIKFTGKKMPDFKIRADEVMSFCLTTNVKIYATQDYINKSRVMSVQMQISQKEIESNPELQRKKNEYLN